MAEETLLQKRIRERKEAKAREEAAKAVSTPAPTVGLEDVDEDDKVELPDEYKKLDAFLETITFEQAYKKWCPKRPFPERLKKDGNLCRCPNPAHPDKKPSCNFNRDTGLWTCHSCEAEGDIISLAMWCWGRHDKKQLLDLKIDMAASFGEVYGKMGDKTFYVGTREAEPDAEEEKEESKASVVSLVPDESTDIENFHAPELPEWGELFPKDTFLDEYMKLVTVDTAPESFHFFSGLLAVGFAMGREAKLYDNPPVLSNIFTCFIGESGTGKSRAKTVLKRLLEESLPFDEVDKGSLGVHFSEDTASAERIVAEFARPLPVDSTVVGSPVTPSPTRGLIYFGEMSSLIKKANRNGSDLKERLMQFCDGDSTVGSNSQMRGKTLAVDPFASCLTTSQPESLRRLIGEGDIDSGFANRWIYVVGKAKPPRPWGDPIPSMDTAKLPLQRILAWSTTTSGYMTLSPEAADVFVDFFENSIVPDKKQSAQNEGLLVRIDLTFKKLLVLLAANKHESVISSDTVRSTIKLYGFLKECYKFIGERVGLSNRSTLSNKILEIVETSADGISRRELDRKLGRFGKNRYEVNQALEDLGKAGFLVEVKPVMTGKRGRPAGPKYHAVA